MSAMGLSCCICKRAGWLTDETLLNHMAEHAPRTLAEELVKARAAASEYQRQANEAERCGKVGYKTEQAATNSLLNMWAANDPRRREVRAYQCYKCRGRWHLTSQPSPVAATVGGAA